MYVYSLEHYDCKANELQKLNENIKRERAICIDKATSTTRRNNINEEKDLFKVNLKHICLHIYDKSYH